MTRKLLEKRNHFFLFLVGVFCFLMADSTNAQVTSGRVEVKGSVVDSSGEKLTGVSIRVKKTPNIGTTTDLNGKFILEVPKGSVLVFSMVGFEEQEAFTTARTIFDVKLLPAGKNSMDDVVVVALGKQKKSDVVGAITTINPEELKVPSSNLTTAIAGRLAGVIAYQRSGEPGADNAAFFIRGVASFGVNSKPLILLDNVEISDTDLGNVQPDDIASFSILKDATATALYGARGANGVVLVTTKRGKEGKARINARAERSISKPTDVVEVADPITYMKLHNEAVLTRASFDNPLLDLPYSQEKIDNTIAGTDPYVYPATNWRKELFKDYTINNRYNFNVSGGGQAATYFLSGTYNIDNGMLKVPERSNFNNNIKLKNYSLRSNVVINLTQSTVVSVLLSGNFTDYIGPREGGADMYRRFLTANPVLFPAYYEPTENTKFTKHILFGNYNNGGTRFFMNPYADMVSSYREYNRSKLNALFEIKQDLSGITQGLAFRGLFNTTRDSRFDIERGYNPFYYQPGTFNKETGDYNLLALNERFGTENLDFVELPKEIRNNTYIEAALSYNRTFQDKHGLSGMVVLLMNNRILPNKFGTVQESLPYRNIGVSGRFTYARNKKYFGELSFGYNGSERFYKTERFGFFPSAGLAWLVSNEDFWQSIKQVIPQFKVRASYGLIGNDAIGEVTDRFFYLSEVNLNSTARAAVFGQDFTYTNNGVTVSRYDNKDITWERAAKANIGLEINLFNNIQIIADIFHEKRTNILLSRTNIPGTVGLSATPQANLGEASNRGIDFSINHNKTFGSGMWMQSMVNFTYTNSKVTKYEEPDYTEKYLSRVGNNIKQVIGYIAERLFVDDADVANSPRQNFGTYTAGDIKYRDINGDGQITTLDRIPIGFPTDPRIVYGFGVSTGYKNIDLSVFFQGAAQVSFFVDQAGTAPFVDEDPGKAIELGLGIRQQALLQEYADSHWSEDNRNIYAKWPRLSNTVISNNTPASTWNQRDGTFLRLKNVELGYTLPSKLLKRWKISTTRLYVNGANLLVWSKFKMWDVEMAGEGLGYPPSKVFNIGLMVGF